MDQGRQTYTEMVVAIIVQAAVVAVAGLVITGEYVMFPLSVCAGAGIAIGLLHHMYNTLDIVLDLDKETATKYARRQSMIRIALMGLFLCVAFYFKEYINPWGVLLGILTLKFSAFFQPVIHHWFVKIITKRREKRK